MIKSKVFEVSLKGNHSLIIPDRYASLFLDTGKTRVKVIAEFEGKSLVFHGALQKYKGQYSIIFGK